MRKSNVSKLNFLRRRVITTNVKSTSTYTLFSFLSFDDRRQSLSLADKSDSSEGFIQGTERGLFDGVGVFHWGDVSGKECFLRPSRRMSQGTRQLWRMRVRRQYIPASSIASPKSNNLPTGSVWKSKFRQWPSRQSNNLPTV